MGAEGRGRGGGERKVLFFLCVRVCVAPKHRETCFAQQKPMFVQTGIVPEKKIRNFSSMSLLPLCIPASFTKSQNMSFFSLYIACVSH